MAMRGKMFRPTLVLLSSSVENRPDPAAVTLAAAVELIHLATLVHDDAIDHSILRRGKPTLNSLFNHQVSVIMGDFLYSTALSRLVTQGNLGALQALTRASTEMSIGELRQLAVDAPPRVLGERLLCADSRKDRIVDVRCVRNRRAVRREPAQASAREIR